MRTMKPWLICWAFVLTTSFAVRADELPVARPEEVGISSAKLERAAQLVEQMIEKREFAGAVTLVACDGKIVQQKVLGLMDIERKKPMRTDTIFRIYSMTKPITTTAAMMLWEKGKFQLDDPVSKYIPQLKGLRVYKGPGDETVPANREVTIRDILRHTSGFSYGLFSNTYVDGLYRKNDMLDRHQTLEEFVTKLGKVPLLYQPGTKFHYSVSVDVLGQLVEVVSGKPLDVFFSERIFKPLDMVDTGFSVPDDKLDRFAANYGPTPGGGLHVIDDPEKSAFRRQPKFFSGGGGLVSTARDYARFCQLMLNGGQLQSTRLLKPETVELMTKNELPPEALPMTMSSLPVVDKSLGFGFGFGVRMSASSISPSAVPGEYYWGGAASTGFTICPKNRTVIISLTQYMPFTPKMSETFKNAVNQAVSQH